MSYRDFSGLVVALLLAVYVASTGAAASQTPPSAGSPQAVTDSAARPSLGNAARKARAEQGQSSIKPPKVYTNANLPSGSGGVTVLGPAPESEPAPASEGKHGPAYFANRMAELQQNLDTHQRELAVLQQKLGQSNVQFYRDPNKELQQQYSRSDIDKLTGAIEEKKKQIEADQKAISDLQQDVQSAGGSPDWLAGGSAKPKADLAGVEKGSKNFWQLRFETARKAVDQADREQKLSEDELDLLKAQQAHDMATAAAADLAQQVAAKQAQADSDRAAAAKAHQELDALQKEFEASGAPPEWSQPEQPQ